MGCRGRGDDECGGEERREEREKKEKDRVGSIRKIGLPLSMS